MGTPRGMLWPCPTLGPKGLLSSKNIRILPCIYIYIHTDGVEDILLPLRLMLRLSATSQVISSDYAQGFEKNSTLRWCCCSDALLPSIANHYWNLEMKWNEMKAQKKTGLSMSPSTLNWPINFLLVTPEESYLTFYIHPHFLDEKSLHFSGQMGLQGLKGLDQNPRPDSSNNPCYAGIDRLERCCVLLIIFSHINSRSWKVRSPMGKK